MATQIGELLVRARALTPADLDEAVSWQVLYGGRLGTNLLELGLVTEKVLAETLAKQLSCESTFGEIELSESMVQAIPGVVARRQEIVPWRLEGKKLKVLCIAPAENLAIFDDIGFRLGKLVKPVIAPEYRIHQLLRRYFGSVRQMRALDFGVKPKGKRAQEADKKAEQDALEKSVDLMDDDAFAAIYAEVMESRGQAAPPAPAPAPAPAAFARIPTIRTSVPAPPPVAAPTPGVPAGWTAAPPARVAPPPPIVVAAAPVAVARDPEPLLLPIEEPEEELPLLDAELLEEDAELVADDAEEGAAGDGAVSSDAWVAAFNQLEQQIIANEPPPAPPEDLSPLTFKEAAAAIAKAEGREGVARAVLRYARSNAARAVMLNVQGDVALGWDAVGEDLTPDVARRIAFPLTAPSAFRLVRESRSHYIGPLGKDAGNVRFLKLAGKKWPASAVLLPILFRGKVVYILYVDNGHKQQVNPDVGELLILSQNISRSMEQLVAKRQALKK